MDLAKLIDFLHQYPAWYRLFVVVWLVVGAVLAGGLIVLRQDSRPSQSSGTSVLPSEVHASPSQVSTPPASSPSLAVPSGEALTVQAYFTTLRALSERFLEKQEFVEKMSGQTVEWEGFVDSVSQRTSYISVRITPEGVQHEKTVYVELPEALRTKAFSLQKGDLIRIKGKLSLTTPSMPDVEATELTVVRPRGAS